MPARLRMASLADQLLLLLGPDRVSTTPTDLTAHSTDKWFASNPPEVVVHAQSAEDVSKVLRFANEHHVPVTPQGARAGYVGGAVPSRGGPGTGSGSGTSSGADTGSGAGTDTGAAAGSGAGASTGNCAGVDTSSGVGGAAWESIAEARSHATPAARINPRA